MRNHTIETNELIEMHNEFIRIIEEDFHCLKVIRRYFRRTNDKNVDRGMEIDRHMNVQTVVDR